jgi:hypothetical protein
MRLPKRLTLETLERIIADAIMVNVALLTAFALRFLSFFVTIGPGSRSSPTAIWMSLTCILWRWRYFG